MRRNFPALLDQNYFLPFAVNRLRPLIEAAVLCAADINSFFDGDADYDDESAVSEISESAGRG
jgi:hypothetical protein